MPYAPPSDWCVSLDVFWEWYGFGTAGVGAIRRNACGNQGKNNIALLQGSEVTAGFHCKD